MIMPKRGHVSTIGGLIRLGFLILMVAAFIYSCSHSGIK